MSAIILTTEASWWTQGDVIKNKIDKNYFFIWSKGRCGLYLCEYLIEQLPKNKTLRFFKKLYFEYLRLMYLGMMK